MLGSITPLGERSRNARWGATITYLAVGAILAGAGQGLTLGWLGSVVGFGTGRLTLAVLATLAVIGAVLDMGAFGIRLPTIHRQVNDAWMQSYRSWVYGSGFGAQLGLGYATVVNSAATYSALVAAFLAGSPLAGALIGGLFGGLRAAAVLPARRIRETADLVAIDVSLRRNEQRVQTGVVSGQLLIAIVLLLVLVLK